MTAAAAQPRSVPLWLKVAYTLFVVVLAPVYWHQYGPANYLWFSDIALFGAVAALWLESRLLASTLTVLVLLPEVVWNVDYAAALLSGRHPAGLADYMFDPSIPLLIRGLSLFHVFLPPLLVWLVWRLGYDPRAWVVATAVAWLVFPLSRIVSPPDDNINWTYGWGEEPQQVMPGWLYVALLMVGFPLLVYLPAHLLLRWLFGRRRHDVDRA